MGETKRRYTREFKLEAVRLSEDPDRTAAETARALGITHKILYRWRQVFKADRHEAFPGHGKPPQREEEVRQLRRELQRVTQERDIPIRAIAVFSQERRAAIGSSSSIGVSTRCAGCAGPWAYRGAGTTRG